MFSHLSILKLAPDQSESARAAFVAIRVCNRFREGEDRKKANNENMLRKRHQVRKPERCCLPLPPVAARVVVICHDVPLSFF